MPHEVIEEKSMRCKCLFALGLVSLTLHALCSAQVTESQPELPEPKSQAAQFAKSTFLAGHQRLHQDYAAKLNTLRKQYTDELEKARKAALENNNLNEAQTILAVKNAVQEDQKAEEIPVRGLKILAARWGTVGSWSDVTA